MPRSASLAVSRWRIRYRVHRALKLCVRCADPLRPQEPHPVCSDCRSVMAYKHRAARATYHTKSTV